MPVRQRRSKRQPPLPEDEAAVEAFLLSDGTRGMLDGDEFPDVFTAKRHWPIYRTDVWREWLTLGRLRPPGGAIHDGIGKVGTWLSRVPGEGVDADRVRSDLKTMQDEVATWRKREPKAAEEIAEPLDRYLDGIAEVLADLGQDQRTVSCEAIVAWNRATRD